MGCSSGTMHSLLQRVWCQILSMLSPLVKILCSMGLLSQDALLALGLVSHVGVLLAHVHHNVLMWTGTQLVEGGREGVIPNKVSLASARAIVNECWGLLFR